LNWQRSAVRISNHRRQHSGHATSDCNTYGYADQRGSGAGESFNVNLPLPVKSGDVYGNRRWTRRWHGLRILPRALWW